MIIKLDFDSTREYREFQRRRLPRVRRMLANVAKLKYHRRARRSSSRKGWHVYLYLTDFAVPGIGRAVLYDTQAWDHDVREQLIQCCVQLLLGSDWKRELLYFMRILTPAVPAFWRQRSNILFRKKLKGRGK